MNQLLSIILFTIAAACTESKTSAVQEVNVLQLKQHVETLAHDSLEGRNAGYVGEKKAAVYVANSFASFGLRPVIIDTNRDSSYFQHFRFTPRRAPEPGSTVAPPQPPDMSSQNALGLLSGNDPILQSETIVLAAHHDGQGMEGQTDPGRLPVNRSAQTDHIWNSTDDNASGVAALLEVADVLTKSAHRLKRSVLFVSFSAEEHGLYGYRWLNDPNLPGPGGGGSEYYTLNPPIPLSKHFAVVDLEMLGRNPKESLRLYGVQKKFFQQAATIATNQTGIKVTITEDVEECCDHIAFHRRGRPAILVGVPGDRTHYHRADDEANQIDYDQLARRTSWLVEFIIALSTQRL